MMIKKMICVLVGFIYGCTGSLTLPNVGGTIESGVYTGTFNFVVTVSAAGESDSVPSANEIALIIGNDGSISLNGDLLYVGFVDAINLEGVSFEQTITNIVRSENKIIVFSDLVGMFYTSNVPCQLVGQEVDIYESNILGGINCTSSFETIGSGGGVMFSMTGDGDGILSK
jgi:hypothetical protein